MLNGWRCKLLLIISHCLVLLQRVVDNTEVGHDRTLIYRDSAPGSVDGELCLSFAFSDEEKGWYKARISLDGQKIGSPTLTLLVLDRSERSRVDAFLYANRFLFQSTSQTGLRKKQNLKWKFQLKYVTLIFVFSQRYKVFFDFFVETSSCEIQTTSRETLWQSTTYPVRNQGKHFAILTLNR